MRGTYIGVTPVTAAAPTSSGGLGTAAIVAIVAGAAIIVGLVIWLLRRRGTKEVEAA